MKKNNKYTYSLFSTLLLCSSSFVCANVVWPALFIADAVLSFTLVSVLTIVLSIIIEAALFHLFLKNISYLKALVMSCLGNFVSATIGILIMVLAMLGWHFLFDRFLGGTFEPLNILASWILMYLGTALIELFAIKLFFKYPLKTLIAPVFIGNLITYALAVVTVVYKYPDQSAAVIKGLFS